MIRAYAFNKTWIVGFLMDIIGAVLMLKALSQAPVSELEESNHFCEVYIPIDCPVICEELPFLIVVLSEKKKYQLNFYNMFVLLLFKGVAFKMCERIRLQNLLEKWKILLVNPSIHHYCYFITILLKFQICMMLLMLGSSGKGMRRVCGWSYVEFSLGWDKKCMLSLLIVLPLSSDSMVKGVCVCVKSLRFMSQIC